MIRLKKILFLYVMFLPLSCASRRVALFNPSEQVLLAADLLSFEEFWLHPAKIAPPTIVFDEIILKDKELVTFAEPVLLEDAEWNSWAGEGFRLFNNRLGIAFRVGVQTVDAETTISWHPESTFIELNTEGEICYASSNADYLLGPLHSAALKQQQSGIEGDYVDRLRGAHQFREVYVPANAQGVWDGIIVFPELEPSLSEMRIVGAIRLTVTVNIEGVRRILVWTFD
jgi:hypothetical protein